MDKIRALLAKAERTEFEEEASAFYAKAQELMIRHAVDEQMIAASGKTGGSKPTAKKINFSTNDQNIAGKRALWKTVVINNRVRMVYHESDDKMTRWRSASGKRQQWTATLVGFQEDIEFAEILYASLFIQAIREAKRAKMTHAQTTEFLIGFAETCHRRMKEVTTKVEDEGGHTTALALRDRGAVVGDHFKELFPNTGKVAAARIRGDASARAYGRERGEHADISGGRNNLSAGRRAIDR
jgi:hypothetical protein